MVLHPRFYPRAGAEAPGPASARELGIGADDFTVLVLFGGKGSPEMRPLCEALLADAARPGTSSRSAATTRACSRAWRSVEARSAGRLHRLGFTDRVAD